MLRGLSCFCVVLWHREVLVGVCFLLVVPCDAVGVVELVEPADCLADSVWVVEVEPGLLEDGEGLVDDAAHVVHGKVVGLFSAPCLMTGRWWFMLACHSNAARRVLRGSVAQWWRSCLRVSSLPRS